MKVLVEQTSLLIIQKVHTAVIVLHRVYNNITYLHSCKELKHTLVTGVDVNSQAIMFGNLNRLAVFLVFMENLHE